MRILQRKLRDSRQPLSAVAALIALHAFAPAVRAGDPTLCYAVSDGSNPDELVSIKRTGSPTTDIGPITGKTNIEAITMSLDGNTVYAVNQNGATGEFGSLNTSTGAFSFIGNIGTGTGALGSVTFADVDGLAHDPLTGVIYGTVRREANATDPDVLIQIDPATGAFVTNAFGAGLDYVPINTSVVGLGDVDDIAVDPADGQMYAVANNGGGNDRLVKVNKFTGAVTDVGLLRLANNTAVTDMEGFSFANNGAFFGTTGSASNVVGQRNSLWQVEKTTGLVFVLGVFSLGSDYEGVGCLTEGSNTITGTVFDDLNGNGSMDPGDPGEGSVTVRLYYDRNNDGLVDAGDTLIDTTTSAANGSYSFEVAVVGNFVLDVDEATLPADNSLTTDNVERANFATFGNTDTGNDFGFASGADLAIVKTASPDPVSPGDTLTYTLTVTNNGPGSADNVVVTDTLPSHVTWVSTTPAQGSCSAPSGVVCELGTLANGAATTVTITTTVN